MDDDDFDETAYGGPVRATIRRGDDASRRGRVIGRADARDGADARDEPAGIAATLGVLARQAGGLALRHPLPVGGGLASATLIAAVALNALAYQPGHHPAPMFETRPFADQSAIAQTPPPAKAQPRLVPAGQAAVSQTVTGQPGGEPLQTASLPPPPPKQKPATAEPLPASPLLRDLQTVMAARGLYRGEIDGHSGAATTEAIRALEKSLGLVPTGEASERLLAFARQRTATSVPMAPAAAPAAPITPNPVAAAPAAVPFVPPRTAPVKPAVERLLVKERTRVATQRAVPIAQPGEAPRPAPAAVPSRGQRAVPITAPQPGTIATAQPPEATLGRVQRALSAMGFGPLRNDGVLDDATVDAIRRYEIHRGWDPTGRLSDRLTLDLLMKNANR
jgi:peptidoglycan hydrolase-like protein with peptidoglycan-binding domain